LPQRKDKSEKSTNETPPPPRGEIKGGKSSRVLQEKGVRKSSRIRSEKGKWSSMNGTAEKKRQIPHICIREKKRGKERERPGGTRAFVGKKDVVSTTL